MSLKTKELTTTLPDGRVFPVLNGETLSWTLSYNSFEDEQTGYLRLRAVIRAMIVHQPHQLERERREMLKASFGGMFGHNARKTLEVIEQEIAAQEPLENWIQRFDIFSINGWMAQRSDLL